jgi:SAM-dependent methyltransferase
MTDAPAPSPLATPLPWDLVAIDYAVELVPLFEHFSGEALRIAEVGASTRVADVACGPGTLALRAAQLGAHVHALDFSAPMIEQLRARIDASAAGSIEAVVGDGMALPWADQSFDAGFSMFGLMFFPDRARGFRELARVLRPGARAVVSSWVPFERLPLMAALFAALESAMPGPPAPRRAFPLTDAGSCREEMSEAGFHDVEVREITASATAPSMRELAASFERTNAPIALAKQRLGDAWPPVAAAIAERMVAQFGEGPQQLEMTANLIIGRR